MARLRSSFAPTPTRADPAGAYRDLRWKWLPIFDGEPTTPEQLERAERCEVVRAERWRLDAQALTDVERLEQLEDFLAERGWL